MGIMSAINQRSQINLGQSQLEEEKKRVAQEAAINSLKTILEVGGEFTGGQLEKIAKNTGMDSDVLASIMKGRIAEHVANSPEDIKAGTAINERKPISASEYDEKFGAAGKDVIYSLPSKEARTSAVNVATEKALSPVKVDVAGKIAKATEEGSLLGRGTRQALKAQKDINKVMISYQTNINNLQQQREIAVKQAMPDANTVARLDEEIRHNMEMEKYYKDMLGIREITAAPGGGNIDALLDAATSAGLTTIDKRTKAVVLRPVEQGSAEDLSLQKLAKEAGVSLIAQPATGLFEFTKEAAGYGRKIQYGFTAPKIKGGSSSSTSVKTSTRQRGSDTNVQGKLSYEEYKKAVITAPANKGKQVTEEKIKELYEAYKKK